MSRFATLLILFCCTLTINAQSRVQDLVERLSRQSDELAERVYGDFSSRNSNNRTDIDNLLLAQQLKASSDVFRRMVQDKRAGAELREMTASLGDMSRRFPAAGNYLWRDTGRLIDDLTREINRNAGKIEPQQPTDVVGRVRWRGMIDDDVQLSIRAVSVEQKVLSGSTQAAGVYDFTAPLPDSPRPNYYVNKIKGRGFVRIVQQPAKENNWTLIVQITDSAAAAREYEFEVIWLK